MANPLNILIHRFLGHPSLSCGRPTWARRPVLCLAGVVACHRQRSSVRIPVTVEEELPVAVKVRHTRMGAWRH